MRHYLARRWRRKIDSLLKNWLWLPTVSLLEGWQRWWWCVWREETESVHMNPLIRLETETINYHECWLLVCQRKRMFNILSHSNRCFLVEKRITSLAKKDQIKIGQKKVYFSLSLSLFLSIVKMKLLPSLSLSFSFNNNLILLFTLFLSIGACIITIILFKHPHSLNQLKDTIYVNYWFNNNWQYICQWILFLFLFLLIWAFWEGKTHQNRSNKNVGKLFFFSIFLANLLP